MPLFRGEITERLVQMAGTSFFGQAAPLSSPRGAAPTTPGAEDEEAELSTTQTFYHSLIIKQLIELGMSSLAQTAACQNLLLARWVSHFIKELGNNYTQDPWVLNCVKGYTINLLSRPHQLALPKELNISKRKL